MVRNYLHVPYYFLVGVIASSKALLVVVYNTLLVGVVVIGITSNFTDPASRFLFHTMLFSASLCHYLLLSVALYYTG